jgi:anti-sigma B factor antagonist
VDFSLTTTKGDGYSAVAVVGELDVYTAPALEEALGELIDGGATVLVVDLAEVSFLDSTGLGLIIKVLKWTREQGGTLTVVADSEKVLKVFRITGLDSVITIVPTLAQAVAGQPAAGSEG